MAEASRRLGLKPNTLISWLAGLQACDTPKQPDEVAPIPPPIPPTPQETRDAAFWRARHSEAEKARMAAEHLAERLAGVRGVQIDSPPWADTGSTQSGHSFIIVHTSDLHMGEVIEADEIDGLNDYNPSIAVDRLQRLFRAAVEIGPRWLHGDPCDGVLLTLGGDLISGDIHDELTRTNALTAHEQVAAVVSVYEAGIKLLADAYGKVHIVAVPGNHGRTTVRPTAKLSAKLSYDMLAASILRDRMAGDSRLTWQLATGPDARVPVYGRSILVTHGDRIGTGGGQGFAGPVLPIIRGGAKVRTQHASAGLDCDLILMGHYHTSAAPPGILANGSVVGLSEYGHGLRARVEPPKQWLARYSANWGLCERLDVQLVDAPKRWRAK